MALLYLFLPWILLFFVHILINPLGLYAGGKILKIESPKFTFFTCVWMSFVAGLVSNFLAGIHPLLTFVVYALLLGYLMKTQFLLPTNKLAILLGFMIVFSFTVHFLELLAVQYILPTSSTQQAQTGSKTFNICEVLSDEIVTKVVGIPLKGFKSTYYTCGYGGGKVLGNVYGDIQDAFIYLSYKPDLSLEASKNDDIRSGYQIQPHDEIQKGAYSVPLGALFKVHFMLGDKHYVLDRDSAHTGVITEGVLLALAKAMVQQNGGIEALLSSSSSEETQVALPSKVKRNGSMP